MLNEQPLVFFLLKYCAFHVVKSMCAVVNVVDGTTTKAEGFFSRPMSEFPSSHTIKPTTAI